LGEDPKSQSYVTEPFGRREGEEPGEPRGGAKWVAERNIVTSAEEDGEAEKKKKQDEVQYKKATLINES